MSAEERKDFEVRSTCSRSSIKSSKSSHRSTAILAAIEARAKAEAARTRAAYAQKEIEVKVKQAQLKVEETRLEATLEALKEEKEAEAALAEATVFEAAADVAISERLSRCSITQHSPPLDSLERTKNYVRDQMSSLQDQAAGNSNVSLYDEGELPHQAEHVQTSHLSPADGLLVNIPNQTNSHSGGLLKTEKKTDQRQTVGTTPASRSCGPCLPDHGSRNIAHSPGPEQRRGASCGPSSSVVDLAKYLARRDLLTAGLEKFDDKPEHYWSWKSTFCNAIDGLELKPSEELDLLVKWLGTDSAEHVKRIRSVHIMYPAVALNMVWQRLEEFYGSAEAMETALFNKLERFPRISSKDSQRLQELGDLLLELESAKEEGYLPGLSYLDTARGIHPILEKLPFSLQEKWMVQGTRYKKEHHVSFPPFSFFSSFIRDEAKMRNDQSFQLTLSNTAPLKSERFQRGTVRNPIMVHKTELDSGIKNDERCATKRFEDPNRNCPLHKKPHPLCKCRGFREKSLEERKTFLKENRICFRCCSSTAHQARDCKAIIHCSECNSTNHIAALHNGPAPWLMKDKTDASTQHGGEGHSPTIPISTTTCTEVCRDGFPGRSCAKICLADVYPEGHPEKRVRTYVILDDQSNKSLAKSSFFNMFDISDNASPYTLKTCAGVTEATGRRANGFIIESFDKGVSLALPTLIECNELPNNRSEIPTPDAVRHHRHLKSLATRIPPLDPEAQILILLGRDLIQAHKVLEQRNGPFNAPFAQRLALGWVVIGEVCLHGAHKPSSVTVYKINVLENGRPSFMTPCTNSIQIKEWYSDSNQLHSLCPSTTDRQCILDDAGTTVSDSVFCNTKEDDKPAPSMEDLAFLRLMDKEVYQDSSNSWVAPLPFRSPRQRLPNNREQAAKRLTSLSHMLRKRPVMKQHFIDFMNKIFENGHAEVAPPLLPEEECWYLPIFGVYHPQKPDQIRVVFDSSAKHDGVSLNDVLLTGPNMNNSLIGVLLRFRTESIAVTADVQHMFHCFVVRKDHRNFLRFLWYRNNDIEDKVIEYRICVHVFGNSPSPAVAMYGLRRAALVGEDDYGPEARHFIERNYYVDDGLASVPTEQQAVSLLQNAQGMLALSNLRLHKIASNSSEVMKAFPSEDLAKGLMDLNTDCSPMQRSLGVSWDIVADVFTFQVSKTEKPYTRRGVLSTINSLFDPLGFAAPVSLQGRSFLRELTMESHDWDAPLSEGKLQEWKLWRDSLVELEQVRIPRQYTPVSLSQAHRKEMHVFCDASTVAIAAVAYLRTVDSSGKADVGFIFGKTKLAPRPEITVPRLELCAAVLAVEIADTIQSEIDVQFDTVTFYSDSRIVLGYIHNESRRFFVYVHNRVQQIRKSTSPKQWRYISTDQNPADQATRSVTADSLACSLWLTGPEFLLRSEEPETPLETFDLIDPGTDTEIRPKVACHSTNVCSKGLSTDRFERFSTWRSLLRAVARLVHIARSFKQEARSKGWHIPDEPCSQEELDQAKRVIIQSVQHKAFGKEQQCIQAGTSVPKQSPLSTLCPEMDDHGMLRIGGRLSKANLKKDEINPLILPAQSHVTTLLICQYHELVHHQGRHFTEGALRAAGLWIIGGKRRVNSILNQCVTCRKLRGKMVTQKMADLPVERLSTEPPFSYVGVDVFGPWVIAARRTRGGLAESKRWAVIFTCMSTRAIHLEVIESLSASSFINALRRFFAIRGSAKQLRSDCGTNFVGASRELKIETVSSNKEVQRYLSDNSCTWILNPPHSSHMGGSWERLIGISRRILDSMFLKMAPSRLTHEVLTTFMAEVSAIVNSRPLIPVSTDPDSPLILSPATLLTQKIGAHSPPQGEFDDKDLYASQWRQVQALANTFWYRWRTEYLPTLQHRRKWKDSSRNLQKGDVVMLKDSQVHRNEWPIGIITNTFPGEDGKVRKIEIKIARGGLCKTLLRPIAETVLLIPSDT